MLLQPAEDGVEFHWYVKDETTLSISRLVVNGPRRQGTGTKVFREWEESIPPQFTKIELWSKSEEACVFWRAMGFENDYEPNEDGSCCMSKAINGPILQARPKASLSM